MGGPPDRSDPRASLRILHLNFHRGWGGQPQRILMASRLLAARGHRIALAVPGDGLLARRGREAGLTVFGELRFRPPSRAISFLRDVRAIRRILANWKPQIIHSHGSQDTWAALVANRWFGGPRIPHMLTRHNTKSVSCHVANRYLYGRGIDRLVVVSGSVLDRYREFIERGLVVPGRVPVIHSAIDIDRYEGGVDGGRVRAELGLTAGDVLIGCVGRLVPDKGQSFLLDAAAQLAGGHGGLHVALVGVGTEEAALRRRAERLGIARRVFFLGFRDDVPEITAALDIPVLPSIDCDASSAVLKEAMAAGRPVVATNIGGAREIVSDGSTGFVVPPRDAGALAGAIGRLLALPDRGRALGAEGRKRALERFRPERLCEDYERAYADLLSERRG